MAALTASQFNPIIRDFYERLKARGKAPKVARCAAARKLVLLAFAIVKSGKPFAPTTSLAKKRLKWW